MSGDTPATATDDDRRRLALPLMEQALDLIDPVHCPGSALLDLAVVRIKEDLGYETLSAAE